MYDYNMDDITYSQAKSDVNNENSQKVLNCKLPIVNCCQCYELCERFLPLLLTRF